MLRCYCTCIYSRLYVCAYMHAHYVHTCHGGMWRSKGGQSDEQVLSPTMWDLWLRSDLASRAFVSRAISLARGQQFERTDWSEAAGSEV